MGFTILKSFICFSIEKSCIRKITILKKISNIEVLEIGRILNGNMSFKRGFSGEKMNV